MNQYELIEEILKETKDVELSNELLEELFRHGFIFCDETCQRIRHESHECEE